MPCAERVSFVASRVGQDVAVRMSVCEDVIMSRSALQKFIYILNYKK